MPDKEKSNAILFVYDDESRAATLYRILEKEFGTIQIRQTFVSSLQYLMVQEPDMVLIDGNLEAGRGLELCNTVRTDSQFGSVPIFLFDNDDDGASREIAAFDAGVDDFVRYPYVSQVIVARIRRLLKQDLKDALGASLSVQVSSQELPGILQYLEAEFKTGHLTVEWEDQAAIMCLSKGILTHAHSSDMEGPDVVTEALCWPSTKVTFVEEELDRSEMKFEMPLAGILMNSSVEVDEYFEIQRQLPDDMAMFSKGDTPLDPDAPDDQQSIYYAALQDYSVDELVKGITQSERKATMWLNQLIDRGMLAVHPPAFDDFRDGCFDFYSRKSVAERLPGIRQKLAEVELPLNEDLATTGVGPADWMSPNPRIAIFGDNDQHLKLLRSAIEVLYKNIFHKRMPVKRLNKRTELCRFDFGPKNSFEFVILPGFAKNDLDSDFHEAMEDVFGVVHLSSGQDRETCRIARRLHKRIHRRFGGFYLHVVSRVRGQEGGFMFKINCGHCGFKLAVDMDEAGYSGECPVCSKPISIPESIDNLYRMLYLPTDMPVVTIEPSPMQIRDLILLMFDSILGYCTADDRAQEHLETEVRGRIGNHAEKTQIEIAETQFININEVLQQDTQKLKLDDIVEEPPPILTQSQDSYEPLPQEDDDAGAFAPIPQRAAPEDEEDDDHAPEPGEIEDLLGLLNSSSAPQEMTLVSTDVPRDEDEDEDLDALLGLTPDDDQ
jgi:DNA-binding response OmpR family regulator